MGVSGGRDGWWVGRDHGGDEVGLHGDGHRVDGVVAAIVTVGVAEAAHRRRADSRFYPVVDRIQHAGVLLAPLVQDVDPGRDDLVAVLGGHHEDALFAPVHGAPLVFTLLRADPDKRAVLVSPPFLLRPFERFDSVY